MGGTYGSYMDLWSTHVTYGKKAHFPILTLVKLGKNVKKVKKMVHVQILLFYGQNTYFLILTLGKVVQILKKVKKMYMANLCAKTCDLVKKCRNVKKVNIFAKSKEMLILQQKHKFLPTCV